jgi:hypothetical protein
MTGISTVASPPATQDNTDTEDTRTDMFKATIPVFELTEAFHSVDLAAIMIAVLIILHSLRRPKILNY